MASRVKKLFQRRPETIEFLAPLNVEKMPKLEMERFQIGIDNMRIDVSLSQKFQNVLTDLVQKIVREDLARQGYADTGKGPSRHDFDAFKEAYRGLLEGALELANEHTTAADFIQLLQLTLLKVLMESPGEVVEQLRSQLQQDADNPARDDSGRLLELHDRMVSIAKYEPGIRYRTLRRLFKVVQQLESKELRKVRKSVLGNSWVIPKRMLFNPLLHLPDLSSETYLMNHYPIICMDRGDERYFVKTNRILCEVFADYLPEWAQPHDSHGLASGSKDTKEGFQIRQREWHGGFSGFLDGQRLLEQSMQEQEFKNCLLSWLDRPLNIEQIFRQPAGGGWLFKSSDRGVSSTRLQDNPELAAYYQRMAAELYKQLQKAGILQRVIASYRTPRLFRQLKERVPIRDIYQYLTGDLPRRQLAKRLDSLPEEQKDEALRALDTVFHYIRRLPAGKLQEYSARYIRDFMTFRRDLKLAYFTLQKMSYIRVLKESENIKLSRDNDSLYEFRQRSEVEASEKKIRAHVVLKADVRGSTEITRQLMQQQLNPATHFSLNFFGPITKLLDRFGAQKVFVEGDALILAVLESQGVGSQSMTVANACGLARKILSVMEAENNQNRAHNLPKLELGLGIAFSDEAPAYLYDEQRKIMISPAINQADRLSSCSAELRKNTRWQRSKRHHVEVMATEAEENKAQKLLRYNVNGIDLDPTAFKKLSAELALRKVRLHSRSGKSHYYHAGRFIDRQGSSHWLVIREALVNMLQTDGQAVPAAEGAERFYEVITDSDLIGRVKSKLSSRRSMEV